jgi:hypothetical protein
MSTAVGGPEREYVEKHHINDLIQVSLDILTFLESI